MILNEHEASAVYAAMCALNNVSGRLQCRLPAGPNGSGFLKRVTESEGNGHVYVTYESGGATRVVENFQDQNAFARAYGFGD